MLRLVFIVIRFIFEIPFLLVQIKKYKNHPEKYSIEERIGWTRKLLRKATKRARVDLQISGVENVPQEGGYLITPNHKTLSLAFIALGWSDITDTAVAMNVVIPFIVLINPFFGL